MDDTNELKAKIEALIAEREDLISQHAVMMMERDAAQFDLAAAKEIIDLMEESQERDERRIEALIAERDEDHKNINLKADFIEKTIDQLAEAEAKVARLVEGLAPFAGVANYMDEDTGGFDPADEFVLIYKAMIESGDTSWNAGTFLLRHFYEARALLAEIKGADHE